MAPILHFQRYSVLFSPLQRVLFQMVPAELCQLVVCDESCLHSSHRRVSADEEEKKTKQNSAQSQPALCATQNRERNERRVGFYMFCLQGVPDVPREPPDEASLMRKFEK